MMKRLPPLVTLLILSVIAFRAQAGTLFYVPIPAPGSDANSGISAENGYTSAVDGGNTSGTHRVVNDITLDALPGSGQSVTADNCTVTALSGTLTNGSGAGNVPADGVFAGAISDLVFNHGASDNSQQEIVLDPASLSPGMTYDLRVYIYSAGGKNRQVNLAFVGDGLPAAETGFFNQDDARTSAGGFSDGNQVYYVNYRYTWDGESTPGITITQKSGNAPFCLYALTNQEVPGAPAGAATADASAAGGAGVAGGEGEGEEGEAEEGLATGMVSATSDQVGVTSDTFYEAESLNSNGRWVNVGSYGRCWQPTRVSSGWRPYTDGNWRYADDCGWTWVSEEPWAWACYHYGRWVNVSDYGWCWTPGTQWSGGWVSWRRGSSRECGTCVGWAPLPPEATCDVGIGVSSWVDDTCDIGPDWWTFINVRDFGASSYSQCGSCIVDRGTYINIYEHTTNITNICYTNVTKHVNIYNGGPDYDWCNTEIRKQGGKEFEKIYVNHYDDIGKMSKYDKKLAKLEGNQLSLAAPKIKGEKNPKHLPKVAENIPGEKVDKGWKGIKDKNQQQQLKQKIAHQTKGKNPANTHAKLPDNVAQKLGKGQKGLADAGAPMGKGQKGMGKGQKALGSPDTAGAGQPGLGQQMGGKGKGKLKGKGLAQAGGVAPSAGAAGEQQPGFAGQPGGGKGLKPGKKFKGAGGMQPTGAAGLAPGGAPGTEQGIAGQTGAGLRPGKKGQKGLKGGQEAPPQVGAAAPTDETGQQLGAPDTRPGKKGKGKGKMAGQQGEFPGAGQAQEGQVGQTQPGAEQLGSPDTRPGKKGKGKGKMAGQQAEFPGGGQAQEGQVGQPQPGAEQLGAPDTRPGKKGKGKGKMAGQQGQFPGAGQAQEGQVGQPQPGAEQLGGPDTRPGKKGKGKRGAGALSQQGELGTPAQADATQGQLGQPEEAAAGRPGRGKGKKGKGQQALQQPQEQPQGFQQPQDQTQSYGQAGGGGRRGGKGGRKQQQAQQLQQQQQQPQGFQQPQDQTQSYGQAGGGGRRGGKGGRKQQQQQQQQQQFQPQQQQQFQPQQQAAGGGGGRRGKKQQQQQQFQPQQQQQFQPQQQQQRGGGGGKRGKKQQGLTPTPTPGY